ncbi:Tannase/feruloyl esterase [Truncatella angustata]|uniref:Carboxylic ester hydrolase n=1 Tax=Truncatella angustata TaxID=152316 RepID=A0A9P8U8H8_9PEZI|nr:Tannase/feruloyl esterase [Truncatella angustata]KAH6645214.1 Tannase/feruloyl esterase [Truncatella angustata]
MWSRLPLLFAPLLGVCVSGLRTRSSTATCGVNTFASLTLANIKVLSLNVTTSFNVSISRETDGSQAGSVMDICRIAVQYTHQGQNDLINTYIGLPLDASRWNSRFLMEGGGGWVAGGSDYILSPVVSGYASSSTDGGHTEDQQASDWGFVSEGNTNWPALSDFASVALVDAARLGKQATQLYYGAQPEFSYWKGCSQGGRQAHMMAQRFPEEFHGIIAGAPGINWQKFVLYLYWPTFMAHILDVRPPACVLEAFREAAIAECDAADGVEDGIISLPGRCDFAAASIVGQLVDCNNPAGTVAITEKMAQLVDSIWKGVTTANGDFEWYGLHKDTTLAALLSTSCTSIDNCTVTPMPIGEDWIKVFLARNGSLDMNSVTHEDYDKFFRQSVDEYTSIIGTDNADLTDLRKAGTKVIAWHGLQDQALPPNGTIDYYDRISANHRTNRANGTVSDYYRLFLAPGVEHCGSGNGFDPSNTVLEALRAWVEKGIEPNTLEGIGRAIAGTNTSDTRSVGLCAYPSVLSFVGGDPNNNASFTCI